MTFTMTDIQQFPVAIEAKDRRGNPAAVLGVPVWGTSDASILTVTAAADGMSAVVVANGPLGSAQVTVSGDGGPNPGDDPFTGVLDVTVVGSKATQIVFSPGVAVDQPEVPPQP